ncbi:hypothetical protein NE237_018695 [Protea cynaroides]|uniref:Uncharacterized protein n=1 Tax=Protea cynaroides TaxID=273540 RepID=A0A9Q0KAJ7_9MAGN|nr:hypothetical protein NE237_018695 [Protea cynaroides]
MKEAVFGEKVESVTLFGRREEILELLSQGFCARCKGLLENRFQNLSNGRFDKLSSSNGNFYSVDSLSLYSPDKSSTSSIKKLRLHEYNAESSAQALEPVASTRHQMNYSDNLPHCDEFNDMLQVRRKKDSVYLEGIDGSPINIVKGLELHTKVFNELEQKKIVEYPKKWMSGKGCVTIQFGCCYNYAKRLVRWHVLPPTCVPNSCIVNIYDKGDCIPPHIDHHDFLRPFCTVSFLTECNILLGSSLEIKRPGQFFGQIVIPLLVGSVLVLNGNDVNIAKYCVPGVPRKRILLVCCRLYHITFSTISFISITFRKMDVNKMPFNFRHDPELQGLQPLAYSPSTKSPVQQVPRPNLIQQNKRVSSNDSEGLLGRASSPYYLREQDFPPLGGSKLM